MISTYLNCVFQTARLVQYHSHCDRIHDFQVWIWCIIQRSYWVIYCHCMFFRCSEVIKELTPRMAIFAGARWRNFKRSYCLCGWKSSKWRSWAVDQVDSPRFLKLTLEITNLCVHIIKSEDESSCPNYNTPKYHQKSVFWGHTERVWFCWGVVKAQDEANVFFIIFRFWSLSHKHWYLRYLVDHWGLIILHFSGSEPSLVRCGSSSFGWSIIRWNKTISGVTGCSGSYK